MAIMSFLMLFFSVPCSLFPVPESVKFSFSILSTEDPKNIKMINHYPLPITYYQKAVSYWLFSKVGNFENNSLSWQLRQLQQQLERIVGVSKLIRTQY